MVTISRDPPHSLAARCTAAVDTHEVKHATTIIAVVALAGSACLSVESDVDDRLAQFNPELESIQIEHYECHAAGDDDCAEESLAYQEHREELEDYAQYLESRPRDTTFRSSATVDCFGGGSVTCHGYDCVALQDWYCECVDMWGNLQSLGYCPCAPDPPHVCAGGDCGWFGNGCGGGVDCGACQVCTVGMCTTGKCCNQDSDCNNGGECIML